jgi:site-specific DNA recombinase
VLYVREDAIADPVDRFLHEELGQRTLTTTLRRLTAAQRRRATAEQDADMV